MASTTRQFARTASRVSTRSFTSAAPRTAFRQRYSGHRFYSSSSSSTEPPKPSSSNTPLIFALCAAAAGGAGYYFLSGSKQTPSAKLINPTQQDYQKVYNEIAARLEEKDDYDDGSYGPVLVRLAWHASGTYDVQTGTGGSNGATMRFAPEKDHGANAGLAHARDFLEPVKGEH